MFCCCRCCGLINRWWQPGAIAYEPWGRAWAGYLMVFICVGGFFGVLYIPFLLFFFSLANAQIHVSAGHGGVIVNLRPAVCFAHVQQRAWK
jgi:hypothetical protein